ncbi:MULTISPECIES: hypothetical protein [unclassified Streptomyces]|uniref:hypothetical protein n=1 Tax=unclassified Streptomyces TaxID=2593676 RepID=UPI00093ABA43|nr:hypothetical protein [Streptomyces sp. CB01883]OKJ80944.1 hypothetical protein AMK32_24885 [Streptomyces sp. CB01883]
MGSDRAAAAVLDRFLALCGSIDTAGCAFSAGSPKATSDGYDQLMRRRQPQLLTKPSSCVKTYESRYLIDGTVLPPGTICRQDEPPSRHPTRSATWPPEAAALAAATS